MVEPVRDPPNSRCPPTPLTGTRRTKEHGSFRGRCNERASAEPTASTAALNTAEDEAVRPSCQLAVASRFEQPSRRDNASE